MVVHQGLHCVRIQLRVTLKYRQNEALLSYHAVLTPCTLMGHSLLRSFSVRMRPPNSNPISVRLMASATALL